MHLTTRQHGAYLLLLMHCYGTGKPLPVNDEVLRTIAREGGAEWKVDGPVVMKFFDMEEDGWHQRRVDKEIASAQIRYDRAVKGAQAKHRNKQASSKPQASRKHVLNDQQAPANPNPTATQEVSPSELTSCDSSARPASRRVKTAPPVALEVPPGWEQKSEKWADFRSKLSDGEWRAWFAKARLNGSELSLLLDSEFAKDQVLYRYGRALEEHFGRRVSLTFDPAAYQAALDKNP